MSPPDRDSQDAAADRPPADLTGADEEDPGAEERAAFRQIGERARYTSPRLRVVTGTFVGPNNFTFERDIVRTFDAVCVVPLESDRDHVLLVRQYRAAVDRPLLELPAGKLDIPGEAPEVCAARELAEEVGAGAGRLTELGHFFNSPGFCDELTFCFLAEDLMRGDRAADGIEEEHLTVERISLESVEDLVAAGEIADAKTIIGLLLARSFLKSRATGSVPLG